MTFLVLLWKAAPSLSDCRLRALGPSADQVDGLTGAPFQAYLVAPDSPIKVALEPVKLVKCSRQGGRDVGSRFVGQPLRLD